jgi:hypothetical protein
MSDTMSRTIIKWIKWETKDLIKSMKEENKDALSPTERQYNVGFIDGVLTLNQNILRRINNISEETKNEM